MLTSYGTSLSALLHSSFAAARSAVGGSRWTQACIVAESERSQLSFFALKPPLLGSLGAAVRVPGLEHLTLLLLLLRCLTPALVPSPLPRASRRTSSFSVRHRRSLPWPGTLPCRLMMQLDLAVRLAQEERRERKRERERPPARSDLLGVPFVDRCHVFDAVRSPAMLVESSAVAMAEEVFVIANALRTQASVSRART